MQATAEEASEDTATNDQADHTKSNEQASTSPDDIPVQVFVTSHSPNFASIAKLSSLICLIETDVGAISFLPRSVVFGKGKREKLERYLDVTRAELFFARRIIFVEGAAELMLVSVLAQKVETLVIAATDDAAKAKALFSGMFERNSGNVSKGRFGQALAQELSEASVGCDVPPYIQKAIEHSAELGRSHE